MVRPRDLDDVMGTLARAPSGGAGVIARGAGRSYGDAAQSTGGAVLDMSGWEEISSIDTERGLVTAQAGVTIARLLAALEPHGLTLPVVPGTRHVTLGGAIASDVHGKNHHCDGSLARHVASLTLCTPAGGLAELTPEADAELFYATLGGMGLTGVVVGATVSTEPLVSRWFEVDIQRTDGLEETLELMGGEERRRYSVAWLDLLAPDAGLGRGIVSRGDYLGVDRASQQERAGSGSPGAYGEPFLSGPRMTIPRGFPAAVLRPSSVRAYNALRWRATGRRQRRRRIALAGWLFPLDGLGEWHRLYGPAGLIQYQFAVPTGGEETLVGCVDLLRARRLPVYLAVCKRLGPSFGGPLSFPISGWTLAVDLPAAAPGLHQALDRLDELVAGCGGRVYLTKDARMRRELIGAMYPRLEQFQAQCARVDPEGVLNSDLSRRLGLGEARR